MNQFEVIIKLFESMVLATTTQSINMVQKELSQIQHYENFIPLLGQVLETSNLPYNIRKATAIYTLKHSRLIILLKDQNKINLLAERLLNIIKSNLVPLKLKMYISQSLETILAADRQKIIRQVFFNNFIQTLKAFSLLPSEQINYQFIGLYGRILMDNPGFNQATTNFILATFSAIAKITYSIELRIEQALIQKNQQYLEQQLSLFQSYTYLLKLYLKRFLITDENINKLFYTEELQPLITKGFNLNLPGNKLETSLFVIIDVNYSNYLNKSKANLLTVLNLVLKHLISSAKQPSLLTLNPTFTKTKEYIPLVINSISLLFKNIKIQKMRNISTSKTMQQALSLLKTIVKNTFYYGVLNDCKSTLIEQIIFSVLSLTQVDNSNFVEQPQEFFNNIIQILESQSTVKNKPKLQIEEQEYYDDDTIKSICAELLVSLAKYLDGTLPEVFNFCSGVLEDKINTISVKKPLILLVLTILRVHIKEREDLLGSLYLKIRSYFQKGELPLKNAKLQKSIEYTMGLILLSQYLIFFAELDESLPQNTFQLIHLILKNDEIQQLPKIVAFELIQKINKLQVTEETQKYPPQILMVLNNILKSKNPSVKLLDCFYSLIRYNDAELRKHLQVVVQTIQILANVIKNQMQSKNASKLVINKCWNIIRQVGQSNELIPLMIPQIQKRVLPLLSYLDTKMQEIDFEEDILLLMNSFIQKAKNVTNNQLLIFQYIPKIFYQRYHLTFGHCFITLQTFIFYGKNILSNAPLAIKSIIEMCRKSILTTKAGSKILTQSDNCEGVLILQSLIISVGTVFDQSVWKQIANIINDRLKHKATFTFLKSNLYATLALIILGGNKCLTTDENKMLLAKSIEDITSFNVDYSSKIYIVTLAQLLTHINADFMKQFFFPVLDIIVTLLKILSSKKNDLFDDNNMDTQELDYKNSLQMTVNQLKDIDEFQYFKQKLNWLKDAAPELLQKTFNELPQSKKDFLKNILAVERIMNEPRQIFKIKRQ